MPRALIAALWIGLLLAAASALSCTRFVDLGVPDVLPDGSTIWRPDGSSIVDGGVVTPDANVVGDGSVAPDALTGPDASLPPDAL